MSTVNVKNTTNSPLGLPRGPVIQPGATVAVEDWEKKQSRVVEAWLDAGALVVEGDAPANSGDDGDSGDDGVNPSNDTANAVTGDDNESDDASADDDEPEAAQPWASKSKSSRKSSKK